MGSSGVILPTIGRKEGYTFVYVISNTSGLSFALAKVLENFCCLGVELLARIGAISGHQVVAVSNSTVGAVGYSCQHLVTAPAVWLPTNWFRMIVKEQHIC